MVDFVAPAATKSDFAYMHLRAKILSGEFEPGKVLNQATLAPAIGVSTTPLREALRRLSAEGLVELGAHRDARISPLTAEEARDLLEMRRSLDPLAAFLAAERRTKEDMQAMRESARELRSLTGDATVVDLATHRRFHAAIYRASHNELLIATLDSSVGQGRPLPQTRARSPPRQGRTRPEGRRAHPPARLHHRP